MGTDYATRKSRLHALADYFTEANFRDAFVQAYINDTAFTRKDVLKREISSTAENHSYTHQSYWTLK